MTKEDTKAHIETTQANLKLETVRLVMGRLHNGTTDQILKEAQAIYQFLTSK